MCTFFLFQLSNPLLGSCPEKFLCSSDELFTLIQPLDNNKANGPDGISVRMLKGTATSICSSLARLFNISICSMRFPDVWKLASVVPVPKGDASCGSLSGYRPISLLSIVIIC